MTVGWMSRKGRMKRFSCIHGKIFQMFPYEVKHKKYVEQSKPFPARRPNAVSTAK